MRLLAALLCVLMVTGSAAAETFAQFAARLAKHVDNVRYDSIVAQSANRSKQISTEVWFRVSRDGRIHSARVSGPISAELREYLVQAFESLQPVRNVPTKGTTETFHLFLNLGG